MTTFQDLQAAQNENKLEEFIIKTISEHDTTQYAENRAYYDSKNPYLANLKIRVELADSAPIDLTPKNKIYSSFAEIIIDHIVSRLWDNPVKLDSDTIKTSLGEYFNEDVHEYARHAAIDGVSWVFYNNGAPQMFTASEFIPLADERNGDVLSGIRYWQIADDKPQTVQLYEMDGVTEWQEKDGKLIPVDERGEVVSVAMKRAYRINRPIGGSAYTLTTPETPGENYNAFPVVPYYINPKRKSELTESVKSKINFYDEKSTMYNDEVVEEKGFMWSVRGYGGKPKDLAEMMEIARKLRIIADRKLDDNADINVATTEAPYLSHRESLERTEAEIYRDARIMNPNVLMSGGVTTVAIRAAMMREDKKMVGVETEARRFIRRLLAVAGKTSNTISFVHKTLVNELEITQRLIQWIQSGVPVEDLIPLDPLFAEIAKELQSAIEAKGIGMSDEDLEMLERFKSMNKDEQSSG